MEQAVPSDWSISSLVGGEVGEAPLEQFGFELLTRLTLAEAAFVAAAAVVED